MKKKLLAMMMTLVMVFSLVACGGGETADPTKAPEPTKAEATKAPEPTKAPDPTKAPEPTKAPDPTEAPVAEQPSDEIDISNWSCYMGILGDEAEGDYIYYAFSEDGTRGGLMLLLTEIQGSVSVFGDYGVDEDGYEYLVDDETGLTIYFTAELLENGEYVVDLGNVGTAVIGAADPQEVIEAMDTILENTTDVTAEFIEVLAAEMEEIDISNWSCYAGVLDEEAGDYIYYAFSEDGTRGGLMFLLTEIQGSISIFGDYGIDEDGYEYLVDDATGLTIYFSAATNEDGTYTIDLGNVGTAVVEAADPAAVIEAMDTILENTTDVTAEFIEALAAEMEEKK